jgi:pimeloyl-ACP methyl ester carboxylesterase
MNHNKMQAAASQLHINLAGVMIGNGWIVPKIQNITSLAAYAKFANMVPPGFALPAREVGTDDDNDDAVNGLHATMRAHMCYVYNPYDIRQRNMDCEACMGYNFTGWTLFMQRKDLREALGVCPTAAYPSFELENQGCLPLSGFDADTTFSFQGAIGDLLEGGVQVLLYYGMSDTVCHFKGGERVAAVIPWSGREAFNALQYSDLVVANVRAGSIKSHGRLSFALVESSGHMVPADQPATAAALLDILLNKIHASGSGGEGGSSSSSSSLLTDTTSPGAIALWIVLAFLGGCSAPFVISRG